jgi:hypothetical protein
MLGSIGRGILFLPVVMHSAMEQTVSKKTLESFPDFNCLSHYLDVPDDESLNMKDALDKYSDLAKEKAYIHIEGEGYRITSDVDSGGWREISYIKNGKKHHINANKYPGTEIEVASKESAEEISRADKHFLSKEGVKLLEASKKAKIGKQTVYIPETEHDEICHPDNTDPPPHVHYAVPVKTEL